MIHFIYIIFIHNLIIITAIKYMSVSCIEISVFLWSVILILYSYYCSTKAETTYLTAININQPTLNTNEDFLFTYFPSSVLYLV